MQRWPYEVEPYTNHEVRVFAVENQEWQMFRLSLKGLPTPEKLDKLRTFYASKVLQRKGVGPIIERRWKVPIDNYINALKRGGQLDHDAKVQR